MRSSEKWTILAGLWTIKLGKQNGRLFHWPKRSCVSTKTKHWKLLLARQLFVRQVDCAVARQNFSLIATAHDCETGLSKCTIALHIAVNIWGKKDKYKLFFFSYSPTPQARIGLEWSFENDGKNGWRCQKSLRLNKVNFRLVKAEN